MLSVFLSSIMFLFVLTIVLSINELMYYLKNISIFSVSIINYWTILKEVMMFLDMTIVGLYVLVEFLVWLKELFIFGKEELFDEE